MRYGHVQTAIVVCFELFEGLEDALGNLIKFGGAAKGGKVVQIAYETALEILKEQNEK